MHINVIISVLVHKAILTVDEAEALVKELNSTILPTDFKAAHRIVESVLHTVEVQAEKAVKFAEEEAARLKADKSSKK